MGTVRVKDGVGAVRWGVESVASDGELASATRAAARRVAAALGGSSSRSQAWALGAGRDAQVGAGLDETTLVLRWPPLADALNLGPQSSVGDAGAA